MAGGMKSKLQATLLDLDDTKSIPHRTRSVWMHAAPKGRVRVEGSGHRA